MCPVYNNIADICPVSVRSADPIHLVILNLDYVTWHYVRYSFHVCI